MIELTDQNENVEENVGKSSECEKNVTTACKESIQHSYDDVLKIIGFGRVQTKIMTISSLLILMHMNELLGISVLTIAAHCDLKMNNARKGIVHACGLWGKTLSTLFWGHLSDKIGRKPVLISSTILCCISSTLSMIMPNFWSFVLMRTIVGASLGGTVGVSLTYLGEFLLPEQRPFLMNYVNITSGVSYVYVSMLTYVILEMDWQLEISNYFIFRPWRLLIICNFFPGIVAIWMLLHFPESPRILIAWEKQEEAFQITDWVCRKNHEGRGLHDFEVYEMFDGEARKPTKHFKCRLIRMFRDTYELFKFPHVWNFLICCIVLMGSFSVSFGLGLWYPVIQNDMIFYSKRNLSQTMCAIIIQTTNKTENIDKCDDHIADTSLLEDFGDGAVCIVGYLLLCLVKKTEHRKLLVMFMLGIGGICGLTLIKLNNNTPVVLSFIFYLALVDLSASTMFTYMMDLIPTELCPQASCLVLTITRISASLTTYAIGLYVQTHCVETFLVFAQIILICALFTYLVSPEMKAKQNQKNLK